jgi:GNAT superfamily N-acetyltransferase
MLNDLDFIIGLMRQNYEALGFIPQTTIEQRYIAQGQFVIQSLFGKPVGYILHGKPVVGGILTIPQAVIDFDFRDRGYGMDAVQAVIDRAKQKNCRAVKVRVAADLNANTFWKSAGFELVNVKQPDNQRKRAINVYILDLWPRLFAA